MACGYSHRVIVSRAFIYFLQLGVLNNLHSDTFNSKTGTNLKKSLTASINCCVSSDISDSKHPNFVSKATFAIAATKTELD